MRRRAGCLDHLLVVENMNGLPAQVSLPRSARVVLMKSDAKGVVINLIYLSDGQKTWMLSLVSLWEETYLMEGSCLAGASFPQIFDLMNDMLNNDSLNKVTGTGKCC